MNRWRSTVSTAFLVSVLSVFLFLPNGFAGSLSSSLLGKSVEGSILSGTANYEWWYGCSPTSAGMMVGYYDRKGYGGLSYSNLVKGGVAESSTFPSTAGTWSYLAQSAIASSGHVSSYYITGYGGSGDDIAGRTVAQYNSLADFMGTSQDLYENVNGSTTFYYYTDGSRLYAVDLAGSTAQDKDGMYGIWEYLGYCGYTIPQSKIYTQLTDNQGKQDGFTFEDYMAEIDAGRIVMLHVQGHSMVGYGYDENTSTVYLYDTWSDSSVHTMTWGGSYSGLEQWGVTCFELEGGSAVPLPPSVLLLGFGLAGIGGFRFRNLRRS